MLDNDMFHTAVKKDAFENTKSDWKNGTNEDSFSFVSMQIILRHA